MDKQHWIDILPPPPPPGITTWWLWGLSVAIITLLLFALYQFYTSPRQTALRSLKLIHYKIKDGQNIQNIPFEISQVIKNRFGVNDLNHIKINQSQWEDYKQQLNTCCFRKNNPELNVLIKLLSNTHYWLNYQAGKNG